MQCELNRDRKTEKKRGRGERDKVGAEREGEEESMSRPGQGN